MINYIFYHGRCPDGELSAAIFKRSNIVTECEYIPWYHHNKENVYKIFEKINNNDVIYFLDVSPSIEDVNNYISNNKIIIIDHHKNAVESILSNLTENITMNYDPNFKKAGCQLTWEYICNKTNTYEIYPKPLKYIGDMDVWNFTDKNTEPFCLAYKEYFKFSEYLESSERLKIMETILLLDNEFINIIIERGNRMIKEYKKIAKKYFDIIDEEFLFDENNNVFRALCIKCDYVKYFKYIIDYAQQNYKKTFDILRIERNYDNKISYSLRILKDDKTVDSIARNYGGNGHPLAAGYSI